MEIEETGSRMIRMTNHTANALVETVSVSDVMAFAGVSMVERGVSVIHSIEERMI